MRCDLTRPQKVALLVERFPGRKPTHRETVTAPHTDGGVVVFPVGKFLNTLTPYFTKKGGEEALGVDAVARLRELPWFTEWLETLCAKRNPGPEGAMPTLDEQVELLCANYATERPKRGAKMEVLRDNGMKFTLYAYSLLDRISDNFQVDGTPSKAHRLSCAVRSYMMGLPWVSAWACECAERRAVASVRKVVTKDMKLELLLIYYAGRKPSWDDPAIPVYAPGLAEPYEWRAATWLDDIADNWLGGKTPNVKLDPAQKSALESLPWLAEWLDGVKRIRARK